MQKIFAHVFHLNRSGPWIDLDGMGNKVSFTIPPIEMTSGNWRRTRMTSLRRLESRCSKGEESRRKLATNHLFFSFCGRASNSAWVVALGGGEVSGSVSEGVAVTSCTDPMRGRCGQVPGYLV